MSSRVCPLSLCCLPYSALATPIRTSALAGPLDRQCSLQGVYLPRAHHPPTVARL
ncbi:hypothetical protein PF010_g26977 [Phytophthora fragariae]|uniref:RxLR effector protein n=1 Tax=Phytophthora fragariae TaxID=53985 RepID=A0A6A3HUJ9_9STRA|nr:hypothetical protein PF009_g27011 [Phytophthora fragariae]KAE8973700.1 hypothetical protein PF011_g25147 [Phytophthora fragariae]KAE9068666.1 hypothetical protein PF010_g26977 [Phytophthora fragariae]KAE9075271.1 hypothetical protein PF007_g25077 [Phytophthora fragariae]KAE9088485.1 hypothetical protein PF006_g25569 [Phytophthora fragariae]